MSSGGRRGSYFIGVGVMAQRDEQLDADSSAGKLDFLFDEAKSEAAKGLLRKWPSQE